MIVKKYVNKFTGKEIEAIQFIVEPVKHCCDSNTATYPGNNFLDIQKFCRDKLRYELGYESNVLLDLDPGDWLISGDDTRWAYSDKEFKNTYTEVSKEVMNKSKTDKI